MSEYLMSEYLMSEYLFILLLRLLLENEVFALFIVHYSLFIVH